MKKGRKILEKKLKCKRENHFRYFKKYLIYLFLEKREGREKEKERNIGMTEKHWLVQARNAGVSLTGTRPAAFCCAQWCPPVSQLSHTSQRWLFLKTWSYLEFYPIAKRKKVIFKLIKQILFFFSNSPLDRDKSKW